MGKFKLLSHPFFSIKPKRLMVDMKVLKYITYRRLSDSSSTFFPGEYFFSEKEVDHSKVGASLGLRDKGLYIHIPFCVTQCSYCACLKKKVAENENMNEYIDYIIRELELYFNLNGEKVLEFDTLVFGGGTPSILSLESLNLLFGGIYRYIDKDCLEQVSFEAAPYLLDEKKIDCLAYNGVTRISLGVQSFDKNVLRINNRPYMPYEKIGKQVEYIKRKGLICVSDLMIGIQGQTFNICLSDYKKALNLSFDCININYFYANKESGYHSNRKSLMVKKKFEKVVGYPQLGGGEFIITRKENGYST